MANAGFPLLMPVPPMAPAAGQEIAPVAAFWPKRNVVMRLIFDGHLDLALFALAYNRDLTEPAGVINQREPSMTDALDRGWALSACRT